MNKGSFPSFFPLHPHFFCSTTSSTETNSLVQQQSLIVKIETPSNNIIQYYSMILSRCYYKSSTSGAELNLNPGHLAKQINKPLLYPLYCPSHLWLKRSRLFKILSTHLINKTMQKMVKIITQFFSFLHPCFDIDKN